MTRVAVVACPDYAKADAAVGRALDLLGGLRVFPGNRVLLKPNLIKAAPADSAVVTHPAVVAAVSHRVLLAGAIPLIGDSPGWGSAHAAARTAGYDEVIRGREAPVIDFRSGRPVPLASGRGPRTALIANEALDADLIVDLPKLKGHVQMTLTGAVKNLFGCVVGKRKPLYHCLVQNDKVGFGHMLLDILENLPRTFTVMDAVVAMEGDGPSSGSPRAVGVIIAGEHPLAVDLVAARITGYREEEIPVFCAARERGIMPGYDEVEIRGDDPARFLVPNFRRANEIDISFTLPRVALSALKGVLLRRKEKSALSQSIC